MCHYVPFQITSDSTSCSLYHQYHQLMYNQSPKCYMHLTLGSYWLCNTLSYRHTNYPQHMPYMPDSSHSSNYQHYTSYNTLLTHCSCSPHCSDMPSDTPYNLSHS